MERCEDGLSLGMSSRRHMCWKVRKPAKKKYWRPLLIYDFNYYSSSTINTTPSRLRYFTPPKKGSTRIIALWGQVTWDYGDLDNVCLQWVLI